MQTFTIEVEVSIIDRAEHPSRADADEICSAIDSMGEDLIPGMKFEATVVCNRSIGRIERDAVKAHKQHESQKTKGKKHGIKRTDNAGRSPIPAIEVENERETGRQGVPDPVH